MNDGTLVMGGRGHVSREVFPRCPVTPFIEPEPLQASGDIRLLRGAWFWANRKVLGLKVSEDDKGQYEMRRADAEDALALFKEKQIAPAAWLAWRARTFVTSPAHTPGLGWLVGVQLLTTPRMRGWFRRSTAGVFGGRVVPTKVQADIMRRWAAARVAWLRGLGTPEETLEAAGVGPVQLAGLLSVERGEVERARTRCASRAAGGDPMPVVPPAEWTFHIKEEKS